MIVIGIDVGVSKGLHVVALRAVAERAGGVFTVLGNGVPLDEAVRLCLAHNPACVAIDSPPGWAMEGNARRGEVELRRLGIQLYATPSDPRKQGSPFYGWMKVGFALFAALRSAYPLYRAGRVRRHALEVFPHATAVVLAGGHRPAGARKAAWRKQVLRELGTDTAPLRNPDCVDAALAAVTALHAQRGTCSAFGDSREGVIVTPHRDAAQRFKDAAAARARHAKAQRAAGS
jgi:predicted nuclease with RNAse H fold